MAESADETFAACGKKYFNGDIKNPLNYDLIINTGTLSIDDGANAVKGALIRLDRDNLTIRKSL